MQKKKLFFLILISFAACNQTENKNISEADSTSIKKDSVKKDTGSVNDTLPKILSANSDTVVFKLKMDSANKHLSIPVTISSGKELFASLYSDDKKANIRISQVGLPDSTFDGPFGRDLHYTIKTAGNYKIIIGEDMMAGDRWTGDFVLKVFVK